MVFNSEMVVRVAHMSADMWQYLSCISSGERISSQQLLDLVCCFPLQQLGRFAFCLWTFLCLPPPDSFYSYSDSDHHLHLPSSAASSSSSSTTLDLDDYYYHSHSD